MKTAYDFVYLTNTPSFYKLNLCNEICKYGKRLLLILYGYGNEAVNFSLDERSGWLFDYKFIHNGDSNKRNKLTTFIRLIRVMSSIKSDKILFAGWLAPEYNLYSFLSPRKKNVMICESSILDVSFRGLSGWIKKRIINRMNGVLPSGQPHDTLFQSINFKGQRKITGSVGIFNKPLRITKNIHRPLKYLYVGRLVDVKNIKLLIEEFNRNGKPLTIVGKGVLEKDLKQQAKSNISFAGFIDNNELGPIYQSHDVFILPSYYEPWGLVVEEALYWGLPVIVSDKVGSSIDMVQNLNTGIIFQSNQQESLGNAIRVIELQYNVFFENVQRINWDIRDNNQIKAYLSFLTSK